MNASVMADNSILRESPAKHIEWSIKNFFHKPTEVKYSLDSPCFYFSDAKWFLKIYANGRNRQDSSGWIAVFLVKNESTEEYRVTFRIGIKKADGSEIKVDVKECAFSKERCGWGKPNLIERSKLLNSRDCMTPKGTLTIFCTIRVVNKLVTTSAVESASQTSSDGQTNLIRDLKNLYFSSRHADTIITVKGKKFEVHRSILSSRSPVFDSMFLHDTEEKSSGRVQIDDCDPDTFENFLLFLYTGKFDIVSASNVVSLYKVSDKYDVKELVDECVRCMTEELSIDVFCDVLHLAIIHSKQDLLKAVTSFFTNNAKNIIKTTKWQEFIEENPTLGNELFLKHLDSKDNIAK